MGSPKGSSYGLPSSSRFLSRTLIIKPNIWKKGTLIIELNIREKGTLILKPNMTEY